MQTLERAGRIALTGIRAAVRSSGLSAQHYVSVETYLLVTICNLPGQLTAELSGCTKQNVSKLLRAVEERREDRAYDGQLAALERLIMGE